MEIQKNILNLPLQNLKRFLIHQLVKDTEFVMRRPCLEAALQRRNYFRLLEKQKELVMRIEKIEVYLECKFYISQYI